MPVASPLPGTSTVTVKSGSWSGPERSRSRYFGVPSHVYIFCVVFAALWFFLTKTRHGVRLVAVGGNAEAARYAGVDTRKVRLIAFALCGVGAAAAALLLLAAMGGVLWEARVAARERARVVIRWGFYC